jgi:hypothetical protein
MELQEVPIGYISKKQYRSLYLIFGEKEEKTIADLNCFRLQRALLFVGQKVGKKPCDFELAVGSLRVAKPRCSYSQNHLKMLRIFIVFKIYYLPIGLLRSIKMSYSAIRTKSLRALRLKRYLL